MADNLLTQAIADAKAVREMAYAEARSKLEEAFKPHLSSMLSAHLRAEAEGLNEDNDASSEIGTGLTVDEPAPKKPSKATSDSSHIENPGLETDTFDNPAKALSGKAPIKEAAPFGAEGEEEFPAEDPAALTAPTGAPTDVAMGDPNAAAGAEIGIGGGGMTDGMGAPDELDLEAIIRELELDSQGLDVAEPQLDAPAPVAPAPDAIPPKLESFQDANAGAKPRGAFDGAVNETLAGKSGDGEFHDGKSPKAVDGVNGGKKVSPGQEVTGTKAETMTENEEINLDEILRELEESEVAATDEAQKLTSENTELKRSLREHREVVQFLRSKLQEVNVLNAKLMFTNKLFKNFDLKLEQKARIVESFDRAGSVREVKLVYATLAESLAGKLNATRKTTAKAITEGMASKPVGSTAPKSDAAKAPILTEGTTQVNRWQKIAGISK